MLVLEFIGQVTLRLGLVVITTCLAVGLGLLDYIIISECVLMLHMGIGDLGLMMAVVQVITLIPAVMVIALLTCVAAGVFGWGVVCALEFD